MLLCRVDTTLDPAEPEIDVIELLPDLDDGFRSIERDQEWQPQNSTGRRYYGRKKRGERTPERTFRLPILQALESMGGNGHTGDVLARVEQLMKHILKDVDYEPMGSNRSTPHWRNRAQWERKTMVADGMLHSGSPKGIWEISEQGRRYLQEHGGGVRETPSITG